MSRVLPYLTCAAALLAGRASEADRAPNLLTDPFQVTLGAFFVESTPTIQLNGESNKGDRVDWDHEFGGVDARRIRLDCHWRISDRQKVRGTAFSAWRGRSKVLEAEIDWGDETYPVNARVDADFSFDILEVAYEYAVLRGENYELNGSLGLHYMNLEASLEAQAEASGGTLTEDISKTARLDAPLPVIGLGGLWSLPHDLWVDASARSLRSPSMITMATCRTTGYR